MKITKDLPITFLPLSFKNLQCVKCAIYSAGTSFIIKTKIALLNIGLVLSCVKVVNNCKSVTFKVNFLCQKWSESFYFFSLKSTGIPRFTLL